MEVFFFWTFVVLIGLIGAFFLFGHPVLSALSNRASRRPCPDCGSRCKGHTLSERRF